MADTTISNAFISLNDIINNFLISYTGPGKLIPDAIRTEVIFHARRCLQEFAYETLKSQFTDEVGTSVQNYNLPNDFVAIIEVSVDGNIFTQSNVSPPAASEYYLDYGTTPVEIQLNSINVPEPDYIIKYLSNARTVDENAAIPKLAEQALYSCMVYSILANRENTRPDVLQRLLIEKTDKLDKAKSRLVFTNFD
jgi:hypothetical protein